MNTGSKQRGKQDSLDYRPTTSPVHPQPPPNTDGLYQDFEGFNESGVFFDDENPTEDQPNLHNHSVHGEGSQYSQGSKRSKHSNVSSAHPSLLFSMEGGSREEGSIDYLGFLGIGEQESKSITGDGHEISADDEWNKGIQCLPNDLAQGSMGSVNSRNQNNGINRSIQFNPNDLPAEWDYKTNSQILEDEILQKKEQLIIQEKQLNDYLSDFYENIQLIIFEFFPKQKFDILQFEYDKSSSTRWQQE